jgi:adenylosuccinate synthase
MAKLVVLLSGSVSSGKSTLADSLVNEFGFNLVKTWELLKERAPETNLERTALQELGETLDNETGGAWVADSLVRKASALNDNALIVVDAVRIEGQIEAIRKAFGARVKHVHLHADVEELQRRYKHRKRGDIKELASYSEVLKNKTESEVPTLAETADVLIKTDRCTKEDVLVRAASHLNLYGRGCERVVDVLVGGAYGSEGKGQVVAYLSREYDLLIRVGGPNAGHKVYEEPDPYTFHLLPSGSRSTTAALVIGPGAVISVPRLLKEIAECDVSADRLSIDPQATIITEQDRQDELALVNAIGSTGQGVGFATARRIRGRGVEQVQLARDVTELKPFVRETWRVLADAFRDKRRILLEGTQGTGLSLYHGFYPHVTSRDTTVAGCLAEAGISPSWVRKVVMVCRTLPIRVQNPESNGATSGYMSQEITLTEVSRRSGINLAELQKTETTSTTGRKRRISEFDWVLLRKAAFLNAPTDIALTFVDYLDKENRKARRFEQLTQETIRFIQEVEQVACAPVSLISTRFHSRSIIDRRAW